VSEYLQRQLVDYSSPALRLAPTTETETLLEFLGSVQTVRMLFVESRLPPTAETVHKLGSLSVFVRVSSCDFVDRTI